MNESTIFTAACIALVIVLAYFILQAAHLTVLFSSAFAL